MNEKTKSAVYVVVLEEGAEWPQWIGEYLRHAANSIVVAYAPGESADQFVARVQRRLGEMTSEPHVGIVACSARADSEQLTVRERVARALLDAMAVSGRGEVLLAASVDGSEAAKHAIFELAGTLCEGLQGSGRVVRVRFSSGRPESGIMPTVDDGDANASERLEHPAYAAIERRGFGS